MFNFSKTSDSCIKCGKCIPTCTIHTVNADEVTSPRGFLDLLGAYHKGELELDKNAKNIFESCFLCTNCVDVCPNSLPVDGLIEQVRYDIAQKYGIAWWKKAFFILLRYRKVMDVLAKCGWIFQSCGFKIKKDVEAMQPRFKIPLIKKERLLPNVKSKTFLNSHQEIINNGGDKKIGIFIGCLANYSYVNIGESLLEILKELRIDAHLLKKQLCCGAPAYFTGDFSTVDYLAKHNIEYFEKALEDIDAIIIPEATCSGMIRIDYVHFFHNQPLWKERALALQNKIYLATEYLANFTDLPNILSKKGKNLESITYHDPCHAKKMQKVYKEPRILLQNYSLTEMSDPDQCCGFGGVTVQSEKFHLAEAAGKPKAIMIKNTNAKIISAECSACRMQITNSLKQNGVENIVFKNPLELIANSLRTQNVKPKGEKLFKTF